MKQFQPHLKGLIFLEKYIPFCVPVVNFVRVTNFEDGIQKNHCWTLSSQMLVFPQLWFSETISVRFFNCCDFISSVDAYWVWLRHFWFCFVHSTLSNFVHPLLKIQQFCRIYFVCWNLQIKPPSLCLWCSLLQCPNSQYFFDQSCVLKIF